MKKRFLGVILSGLLVTGMFVGCDEMTQTSADMERKQTEETMKEIANQVGSPNITNFTEKKLAKKIFEMRDDAQLITYAYTQNMDGKYVYLGTCIGYGLPYSVQYTSPEKIEDWDEDEYVISQADPNGLYMPEGLSATWLVLVDEETGEQSVNYIESEITVTQSKLPARLCEEWSLPSNY